MSAIPDILTKNGYVVHAWDWKEPLGKVPEQDPLISVGIKVGKTAVKQIATIEIELKKVRFCPGNGYRHDHDNTIFSTYLSDSDENKFILDFKEYTKGLAQDPYGDGVLVKHISKF